MLFEFMKLTNQIVIDVLIVVAHNEFYVISVSVGISCQISKTFKHGDSDKFYGSNSHQERNKKNSAFIIVLFCMVEQTLNERTFHFD